jgi:membrane-associated phospholipid phosphatase
MQSMAIVAALLILLRSHRSLRACIWIGSLFVVTVGLCRMYLGVHYPSDILAGWALSGAWVCALGLLFDARYLTFNAHLQLNDDERVRRI